MSMVRQDWFDYVLSVCYLRIFPAPSPGEKFGEDTRYEEARGAEREPFQTGGLDFN